MQASWVITAGNLRRWVPPKSRPKSSVGHVVQTALTHTGNAQMKYLSIVRHGKSIGSPSLAPDFGCTSMVDGSPSRRPGNSCPVAAANRFGRQFAGITPTSDTTKVCAVSAIKSVCCGMMRSIRPGPRELLGGLRTIPEKFEHVVLIGLQTWLEQLVSGGVLALLIATSCACPTWQSHTCRWKPFAGNRFDGAVPSCIC